MCPIKDVCPGKIDACRMLYSFSVCFISKRISSVISLCIFVEYSQKKKKKLFRATDSEYAEP